METTEQTVHKSENDIKKEYLCSYANLCRQIKRIERQIRILRMDKISPSMFYDDMPKGCNQQDLSAYAAQLDQLEREYIDKKLQKLDKCQAIMDKIEELESENEKDVLTYRYIGMRSWEDICHKMGYSWQHTHRIHAKALQNLKM